MCGSEQHSAVGDFRERDSLGEVGTLSRKDYCGARTGASMLVVATGFARVFVVRFLLACRRGFVSILTFVTPLFDIPICRAAARERSIFRPFA